MTLKETRLLGTETLPTEPPGKGTMRKNRALTYAVLAIAALLVTSSGARAGLINQETGEVYIPTMDEDGNIEEPPDWVPQVGHESEVAVFESEVVVNEDYCWSAVDEWLGNGDEEAVLQGITDPETRDELFATIQGWIRTEIAEQQENLPDDVTLGLASLTRMACPSSTYTYFDCLQDGIDWSTCKRMYPKQPIPAHSELSLSVPASGSLGTNGTIILEGGLRYRETTRQFGSNLRLGCFGLDDITVTGFVGLQGFVEEQVRLLFTNNELCLTPP
jgi:hypothetical protein